MAFTVTPTSGANPYVFNITFDNDVNFGAHYIFEVAQVTTLGSCVFDIAVGNISPTLTSELFASGTSTYTANSVDAGHCRSINARIRRVADGKLISGSTVTIDNV